MAGTEEGGQREQRGEVVDALLVRIRRASRQPGFYLSDGKPSAGLGRQAAGLCFLCFIKGDLEMDEHERETVKSQGNGLGRLLRLCTQNLTLAQEVEETE